MESTVNLNHNNQSYIIENQWACQAQMESRRMFEELTTKSRLYQENHASDCMEKRNCGEFVMKRRKRVRQLRTDELYAQKKEEPHTMNQLFSRIRTLQDKVNASNEEK